MGFQREQTASHKTAKESFFSNMSMIFFLESSKVFHTGDPSYEDLMYIKVPKTLQTQPH